MRASHHVSTHCSRGARRKVGLPLCVVLSVLSAQAVAVAATAQYVTTSDVLNRPRFEPDSVVPYGPGPQQFGHLRLPTGSEAAPVAVLIHGGCWLSFADLRYFDELAEELRRGGWATWNLEFRRMDQAGGGWPGTFQDVAAGTDHLRRLAQEHDLDLERVVVLGHSSGGHLALWVAGRGRIPPGADLASPDPLPVRAAVSLGGVADLGSFHTMTPRACGPDAVTRLMGGTPEAVAERYRQGSPAELLPLGVPQLLLSGRDDAAVPPLHVEEYGRRARESGDRVETVILPRAAHFEVIAPWSPAWPRVKERLLRFLEPFQSE